MLVGLVHDRAPQGRLFSRNRGHFRGWRGREFVVKGAAELEKSATFPPEMGVWVVENSVILAAIAVLLLTGSLPAPAQRLRFGVWLVLVLAVLGGASVFRAGLQRTELVPDSTVSRTLKYALRRLEDAHEANVLLIDGGSLAQKGVDGPLLERELRRLGYSVRTVRLALSAANHFERYELYRDLLARLPHRRYPDQRWVMLAELCVQYDLQPLAQFHGNRDTTRALHYLTPDNALQALSAQRDPQLDRPSEGPWRWDLARQVSINAFNVGVTDRLKSLEEMEAERGGVPGSRERLRKNFDVEPLLEEIRHPTPDPASPAWLKRIRERRLLRLWGDRLDELVYFGTPSTRVEQLKHVRGVCKNTRRKCLAPTDKKLYRKLDSRKFWLDEAHLNRKGARLYTLWLAARLVKEGVLRK